MKASELRIGNLFNAKDEDGYVSTSVFMVSSIGLTSVSGDDVDNNGSINGSVSGLSLKEVEPIPLTEEWLVKFGFENIGKDSLGGWTAFIKRGKTICSDVIINFGEAGKNFNLTHSKENVSWIKYVHQLQNLYFALTGQELTIPNPATK